MWLLPLAVAIQKMSPDDEHSTSHQSPCNDDVQEQNGDAHVTLQSSYTSSILEVASDYIDGHLRQFRMLPWVVAAVGTLLVYKYSRVPLRRLSQLGDVPPSLLADNIPLRGVVRSTSWNSLGVWHVPTWRRFLRVGHRPPGAL